MRDQGTIKTKEELEYIREAGRRLAVALDGVAQSVAPGVTPNQLNTLAEKLIRAGGDVPSFLNHKPDGAKRAFPATLCVSVNDHVVHGIPTNEPLSEGDIVGLDLGLIHHGFFVDAAVTVPVGEVDDAAKKLIFTTKAALEAGISAARGGGHIGDISEKIENCIDPNRYGIVRELGGHGVGYAVHEMPYVPNYGSKGEGPLLRPGMVLAIEPMVNEGGDEIDLAEDKFTYRTADGSRSAHFEHTIIITEGAPEIVTKLK